MRLRVTAVLATLLVLAGCGPAATEEGTVPATPEETSEAAPLPSAAPSGSPRAEADARASDLAGLAEELAGDQPTDQSVAPRNGPVLGADISWPQCPKGMGIEQRPTLGMPMPVPEAEYVVIGLTNGPGFTPNPCLADQVDWVAERGLLVSAYSVLSYPTDQQLAEYGATGPHDSDDRLGRLRNVGHQQAAYNLATMQRAGLQTPIVWLDVEPVRDWEWSADKVANAAVVEGAARAYREEGYEIGVYSTPYMWDEIVGGFELGVPEWRAAGQTSRAEAASRCGEDWSIQGGRAVFGQWVADRRDHNITCPGIAADLGRWFHAN
ncbi:hypothetical protein KUV85_06020 [Nocardioides panacisoli]|uniref:hypothetical protein n=1 Tax=Nocardioides panacisoli TaxID=627624 RepID=UPI001C635006|nr:hypothetical protein [Nocardioides panacisoli]QYJ05235.1 hypothetical protein KUV85_06020 [Nocardioides panacisoli]